MFVRFRQTKRKLQVSLCETRWTPNGPRQEHIAQLGSVPNSQTIEERIHFWKRLDERLAQLANRVSGVEERDRVFAAIQTRIPAVRLDEVREFKIEAAEASERFWTGHRELWAGTAALGRSRRGRSRCDRQW
jgi:hypothetical protein